MLAKKIVELRKDFHSEELKKGGKNTYYKYFELADFIPQAMVLCEKYGVCPVVSFSLDVATLTIYDTESEEKIIIESPMSTADMKGCQAVQNLGAVQTYLRRYLWGSFLEIVEHDKIEEQTSPTEKTESKPKTAPEPKKTATPIKTAERTITDADIKKAREIAGLKPEWIIDTVKTQFAKEYKDLTQIEKATLLNLIQKELNK